MTMSLGNCYLIAFIIMVLNVVIGGTVCEVLNFSQPTSYALGFSSVFVLLPVFVFIVEWMEERRGR